MSGTEHARLQEKFSFGIKEHRAGRLQKARQVYKKILKASPQYVDVIHMLGLLEHQSGKNETAVSLLNRAVEQGPASAELFTNLGSALQAQGAFSEAIDAFRKAIGINPRFALAYNNLGNALRAGGDVDAALDAFRQAIRVAPDFALAYYNLGDLLHAQGREDEAIASMKRALALEPEFADACNSLATMLMEQGAMDEARGLFERTLQLDNENTSARHMLAALEGHTTKSAPAGYVVGLFDGCAAYFDRHLVEELGYTVPRNLHKLVSQLPGTEQQELDVMDLGCGTGLCGPLFRGMARTMVGVDLSPGMLARAGERKLYDKLVRDDITNELRKYNNAYDLILAADVFIYVGRLDQVFEATTRTLRPGGLFAFSIETESGGEDYVLRPSGRYAHSVAYIRRLANAVGLREVGLEESVLRMDKGQPIDGYIVVLEKPVE
ncbi:MAG: tetratricopeptide repeat protein [Pseudomonadota bacterium]